MVGLDPLDVELAEVDGVGVSAEGEPLGEGVPEAALEAFGPPTGEESELGRPLAQPLPQRSGDLQYRCLET